MRMSKGKSKSSTLGMVLASEKNIAYRWGWCINCRKQYLWCSLRGKLAEVAVYSLVRSRFCRNKHSAADYCGNLLGSRGIGAGSSPLGCEGFVKASKVQGSSLLLSNADNFVGYSYI